MARRNGPDFFDLLMTGIAAAVVVYMVIAFGDLGWVTGR
jgi:hypothetical protein